MQQTQSTPNSSTQPVTRFFRAPKLAFYHPNNAGTGSAIQIEPRLNTGDSDRYNCFFLEIARQKTAAKRAATGKTPATFDWENKMTVKLDFTDVCELLTVLDGKSPAAGGTRNGLYHESEKSCTIIAFQKKPDREGYYLGLSRKDKGGGGDPVRLHIVLSEAEATGLRHIFQTGLFFITFHAHILPSTFRPPISK